ncbi:hypothetical protein H5410_015426 [Solanum commersonii]|uniref:At2g35280-like TPR domain-containing protein n=1 Tax=Solanum commersonii TaxID=4109 RepID=A0A9J5ZUC4_SOLCO|nr:hypothetical protein H5410_015426 [Solanum commersonii]
MSAWEQVVVSSNRYYNGDVAHGGSLDLEKISCPYAIAVLRAQYGADFGNQTYEYSFPYYSMEKYIMAYCEEIHPVPLKILGLSFGYHREIPLSKLIQANLEEGDIRGSGVGGSFPTRKNKCSFDLFSHNDPTALGMINQAADGGHIGASYVLSIISIFNDDESMKEGGMWVLEPNLLGGKPICCTVHQFEQIGRRNGWPIGSDNEDDIRCDLELDYVVKFQPYTTAASGNLEALYRKGVYDFFNRTDSNRLGMLNQAADGGHIGASYVIAIISIFNGGESMREGLMLIANMTTLKLRRCREKLRYTLFGRVLEPHLLGERPICCTVQSPHFACELCSCDLEINEVVKFLY